VWPPIPDDALLDHRAARELGDEPRGQLAQLPTQALLDLPVVGSGQVEQEVAHPGGTVIQLDDE